MSHVFHLSPCRVRIQTMAFPHWFLQGHWRDPSHQLHHFPRESGLGVPLGNGHGEGEPRFPLHLQWQDHNPCLGVVRFLAATDKIAYIILLYWFLICYFCLLQNVYLHECQNYFLLSLKNLGNKELKIIVIKGSLDKKCISFSIFPLSVLINEFLGCGRLFQ